MVDRILALIFLSIILPVFVLLMAFQLLFQGKPVFFKQERVGRNGRKFVLFKFRTMTQNNINQFNDANILQNNLDTRITSLGRFMRGTSLDELPQLFNILKGEMNFVGPRPILPEQLTAVKEGINHKRFLVKPGITGLAQIKGRRGLNWLLQLRYDGFYAVHKNAMLNLFIVCRTVFVVFNRSGVYGSVEDNWRSYIDLKYHEKYNNYK